MFPEGTMRKLLKEELQRLEVLKEVKDLTIPAGSTDFEVLAETSTATHKFKTVTLKGNYAFPVKILCYDLPAEADPADPYHSFTLTANRSDSRSWEEDFKYCKVLADNPDTVDQIMAFARLKGRKL